jgi:RHS repeat-associated protein
MLKKKPPQDSFYGSYLYDRIVPKDHLLRKLNQVVVFSFGAWGFSQGEIGTDRLFTGQRLDGTGLYYYGARYYDPTIGRFVSADPTTPDPANPQAFNKYSYVINNPTSAIDPSGLDYIFVGGASTKWTDQWWTDMLVKLDWDPTKDKVLFIPDPNPGLPFETNDQSSILRDALASGYYQDIKIIGHSEGALASIRVLDELAKNNGYMGGTNVGQDLTAVFSLDAPTGLADSVVMGNTDSIYTKLLERVHDVESMRDVGLADIWNRASIVHAPYAMPGWEGNSYSYDSRSLFWLAASFCTHGLSDIYGTTGLWGSPNFHNDVRVSDYTISVILSYIGY